MPAPGEDKTVQARILAYAQYEIISPNAFLRPFIDEYTTLSSIYALSDRLLLPPTLPK